jgi:hypothetical protein
MPSFLYPRTISIRRANTVAGSNDAVGDVGYSGQVDAVEPASNPQGETVLFTNVPCSIQVDSPGRPSGGGLPQDATHHPRWRIFIPGPAVPKGMIRDRDIIIDDESYRYEVISAYWTPLGWSMPVLRLEA